jgi:hypothetical protein
VIPARRLLAAALVALCTLLLAACGGSDKGPSSAQDVLKETFGPDKPIRSGKVDVAVTFDATGLQGVSGPVKLSLKGPFQSQGGKTLPLFDFDIGLTAGGTTFTAGAVSADNAGYLKFQGTAYALTNAIYNEFKQGYEESAKTVESDTKKSSGPSFRTLGIDPLRWLSAPKKIGTEQVGGTETTHVSATVDVAKLLADVDTLLKKAGTLTGAAGKAAAGVPDGLTAAQRKTIENAVTGSTFDVWAGKDDGTLRKIDVSVDFSVPQASQAAAGGLQKGKVELALTIADLNKKQTIAKPTSTRPFSELQSQLSQLISALTGGGAATPDSSTGSGSSGSGSGGTSSGGTGTGTTSTGSGAAPLSAYDQCLQDAGSDIAKVNECAKLQ